MKIVLIGNYSLDEQASMLRYAAFLERELTRAGHDVRLISPQVILGRMATPGNRLAKWLGYLDKLVLFRIGFSRRIRDADIVHVCDHSNSPYLAWVKGVPKVITCHDALAIRSALGHYPINPTRGIGKILQLWIRKSLRRADRILYVSEKTRFDFEQLLGISVPSEVILHALNWPYSKASDAEVEPVLQKYGLKKQKYILQVGGNVWYKNRHGVMQMFAHLQRDAGLRFLSLAMVGKPLTKEMHAWLRENDVSGVLELVNVDNAELRMLYTGAAALLFPSFEEGFGWPIIEAQACGCPVITSNRAPMSEIAGEGATLIDPTDHAAVKEAVRACIEDRDTLVNAGFRNLERFSLESRMRRYEAFYEKALEPREAVSNLVDSST